MYEQSKEYHLIENFSVAQIPPMTDKEAKCYLKRYTKLRKVFGKDIQKAKNHWKRYGFEENRNKNCYDEDNNILLEDEDIIEDNNEGSSITIIVLIGVAILLLLFLAYYLGYIF